MSNFETVFSDEFNERYVELSAHVRAVPDKDGFSEWRIAADVDDEEGTRVRIATMSLHVANFATGALEPVDGDDLEEELGGLMQSYWNYDESECPSPVGRVYDNEIAAFVGQFEVDPDWRGTPWTPVVALEMLSVVASIGVSSVWLYAHPIGGRELPEGRKRDVCGRIAEMWKRAGFTSMSAGRDVDRDVMARGISPDLKRESEQMAAALPESVHFY